VCTTTDTRTDTLTHCVRVCVCVQQLMLNCDLQSHLTCFYLFKAFLLYKMIVYFCSADVILRYNPFTCSAIALSLSPFLSFCPYLSLSSGVHVTHIYNKNKNNQYCCSWRKYEKQKHLTTNTYFRYTKVTTTKLIDARHKARTKNHRRKEIAGFLIRTKQLALKARCG